MYGWSLARLVCALAGEENGDVLLVLLESVDDLRSHLLDDVLLLDLKDFMNDSNFYYFHR